MYKRFFLLKYMGCQRYCFVQQLYRLSPSEPVHPGGRCYLLVLTLLAIRKSISAAIRHPLTGISLFNIDYVLLYTYRSYGAENLKLQTPKPQTSKPKLQTSNPNYQFHNYLHTQYPTSCPALLFPAVPCRFLLH